MLTISEERMSDHFTKSHIKGLPFDAVFHHFTTVAGENIHDHPYSFVSHVLRGSYVECVYTPAENGLWASETIHRRAGTVHRVEATHIHEIIELPDGECWTVILPEAKVREPLFWKFDDDGYESRAWYEGDFQ